MKKNRIIRGLGITLGVIAFIGAAGSVAMGGYIADRILLLILVFNPSEDRFETEDDFVYVKRFADKIVSAQP